MARGKSDSPVQAYYLLKSGISDIDAINAHLHVAWVCLVARSSIRGRSEVLMHGDVHMSRTNVRLLRRILTPPCKGHHPDHEKSI